MTMGRETEFDIVLWGATGFTGRLAAEKLAARIGGRGDLRWAIGGRNQAKLESVRSQLGPAFADLPVITGDSHDVAALDALADRTRVVCSTVGPYAMYGSELVGACVRAGTHYCDISAEAHWIRKMIDAHAATAAETGARIVHACGMDSIPSDLGVHFLQRGAMEVHGKPCPRVRMRVIELRGGFSGGTAASLLHGTEAGRDDPSIGQSMRDPYYLAPEGHRHGPDAPESMTSTKVEYDEDLGGWIKPFFMGPMNTKIVRRTNAVLGHPYGEDFSYGEATLIGSGPGGWLKAKGQALGFVAFIKAVGFPPTRRFLKKRVLPASGEGPSREVREAGHWEVVLIGTMNDGTTMQARVRGEGDPSAESTTRMVTESALCLAEDSDEIPVGGGSWTPASAMGDLLLTRLEANAGMSFELEPAGSGEGGDTKP
jgi:short subunit dehydrogenase-like uncharacterized protein